MSATTYAPDALTTLRDSFALHLDATRAPKTRRIYLDALDSLIRHLEANGMPTGARAVRREHIEAYLAARRTKIAPSTLSVEYRPLQQFFRRAFEEDEIERDPTEKMKAPKVPESPVPVVSAPDFKKLIKTVEGKDFTSRRDKAVLLMLYDTGMRAGELIGLRLEDIDLRGRLAYVTGKGGHVRAVCFGATTAVAIDRYLRLRRSSRYADTPWLWVGQRGKFEYSALAVMLAKRCDQAGLPRLHAHQLRHSFAHNYLAAGGNETDLQRLAGWRSPVMLRRYGASMAWNFELVAAGASGDLAYTVGYESHRTSVAGGPVEPHRLRLTHVYRREDGMWKIVHRHGDELTEATRSR